MTHFDPQLTPWSIDEKQFSADGSLQETIEFLVRYAVLAPSSHNSQPWQFRLHDEVVDVLIDRTRWLRVADADQRELHNSVGCALENLLVAADHFGWEHVVALMPDSADPLLAAGVTMSEQGKPETHRSPDQFQMITVRHTNHGRYDGHPIPDDVRQHFVACCVEPVVFAHLTDDLMIKQSVDEWVVKGDAIQFAKPEYREERADWIGREVFGTSWLMSELGQFAVSHFDMGKSIAKKDSELFMSSPVFALIASKSDDRAERIMVGQVYQRISLLAASYGIGCQPMSQLVEVPELRNELVMAAPEGGLIPQRPSRMGYAQPEKEHTPRRPVSDAIVT